MKAAVIFAVAALAVALPAAADEHVGYDAERGDPARWYEPVTTPKQRYENEMKEARNALAEAIKECRHEARNERAQCEREAREQQKRDMDSARAETGYREERRR
jgi:Skp family chaperone for outer membrane proteins